jgi:hypothetical protein
MNQKREIPRGLDGESEYRALLRARDMACEMAARTGTPLVIWRDGKIEYVQVAGSAGPAAAGKDPAARSEP